MSFRAPASPPKREFRQQRSRDTYQALLASAGRLFSEEGYRGTQVLDIASDAGLSVGAFYRYFEDKRAILIELMHIFLSEQNAMQAAFLDGWRIRLVAGDATGEEFIDALAEAVPKQYHHRADLVAVCIALSQEDERVAALRRTYDEADQRDWARFIAAVTPRERIPSPLAAARAIDVGAEEVLRQASRMSGRAGTDMRAALRDMLLRYLFG